MRFYWCILLSYAVISLSCRKPAPCNEWSIICKDGFICIHAGILHRELTVKSLNNIASDILLNGNKITSDSTGEISFTLWRAMHNAEPVGIRYSPVSGVDQVDAVKNNTDALHIRNTCAIPVQSVKWIDSVTITRNSFDAVFDTCVIKTSNWEKNADRLVLSFKAMDNPVWQGLNLDIIYEIYKDYPVIRKRVHFSNEGSGWLKVGNLMLDPITLKYPYVKSTLLTPAVRGLDSDIVAISDSTQEYGIIQVSEVPSKIRLLTQKGVAGYNPDFFEWIIGPGESFESEAVFMYAFAGESYSTKSAISTALDRCVESEFRDFLKEHVLMPFDSSRILAPLFCTWTNYSANINEQNMRVAADIASRIGFRCFQLDAGWSDPGPSGGWAVSTIKPNPDKFPDLGELSNSIQSKGMKTGLWYSVFINEELADKSKNSPGLFSLPLIRRAGGLGIGFAYNEARDNYIDDIVFLHRTFQADYFKQDLSNICYGDIAYGHESRTIKESYLRGLRGFFLTQDRIHQKAPNIYLQLSHEIYWETPGPAADVAVLQHADSYHISPNEYWGAGKRSNRVDDSWEMNPDSLSAMLIQGCLRARNLMYAHRGLPLERLEVFGAVITNYQGSLTPEIQDRQICSWLMGSPLSFSGDLSSLTEENITRYNNRFTILKKLEKEYGIYSCFQYSGVPEPTDSGWHWWGKLNRDGCGAVIILRGSDGADRQCINIPWVLSEQKYVVKGLLTDKEFGIFTGKQLQDGALYLSLKRYGQEIIEIALNN